MNNLSMISPILEEKTENNKTVTNLTMEYINNKNSIGYSYYYYAKMAYDLSNVKLLSINGIASTDENIQNGTYPIRTGYYVVINANEVESSNTRKLVNAMLSDRGKSVAKEAKYVTIQ